jgi:hypothetical protein
MLCLGRSSGVFALIVVGNSSLLTSLSTVQQWGCSGRAILPTTEQHGGTPKSDSGDHHTQHDEGQEPAWILLWGGSHSGSLLAKPVTEEDC